MSNSIIETCTSRFRSTQSADAACRSAFKYVYDSKGWFGYTLNAGNDTPVLIEPLGYHNTMGPLPFHNMQWNVAGPMSNGYTVGAIPGLGYSLGTAVCFVNGQYQNNQTSRGSTKNPVGPRTPSRNYSTRPSAVLSRR